MSANDVHRIVLWLFGAVLVDSIVAVVLRFGSIQAVLDGDRSFHQLVALAGLASLGFLVAVTLRTAQDLLGLRQQVTVAETRVAVLEASAMMSRAQSSELAAPVHREIGGDPLARQRMTDLLERGNLTIAMQPIVDLQRDQWVAAEALSRFPDGRGPDVWFREAEEMGLHVELDLLAFITALARAPQLPPHIGVSINASPSLILDPRLSKAIYESGIALDRLTVEITEHAAVTGYHEINAALLVLRERGMHLAVDDTGAGFASFNHVLKLRPDVIKLDRSMVQEIGSDAARRAFVTAVVLLALELDASITAEGVETRAELDAVAELGVDHAQGYFLARPDTLVATWDSWTGRRWVCPRKDTPTLLDLDA